MSDSHNSNFIRNAETYIQTHAIDPLRMIQCVNGHMDLTPSANVKAFDTYWSSNCANFMGAWDTIQFDLKPRTQQCSDGTSRTTVVLRVDQRSFSVAQQQTMAARRGGHANDWKKFDKAKHPIQGYWFPYNVPSGGAADISSGKWGIDNMGYVDIPRTNPPHNFAFTGGMNGCALVITDSPVGTTHMRVYHYPNADSYPQFKNTALWPNTVRGIWPVEEYGSDEVWPIGHAQQGRMRHPASWNFLVYKNSHWHVASQPHIWHQTTVRIRGNPSPGIPMTSIRTKTTARGDIPGIIRIDRLGRQFP